MEQWRITTARAGFSSASGAGRTTFGARVAAVLVLIVAVGLGVLLVVPALVVGAIIVGVLAAIIAVRRAMVRVFRANGRRNVRVIIRDE